MDKTSGEVTSFDGNGSVPRADIRALTMRIKRTVRRETSGGVVELDVRIDAGEILLRGRCNSFYCKQLAQTAAMRLSGGATVVNEIEVAESADGFGGSAPDRQD